MSIFDNLTTIFGNPLGTMAFTTPDSLVGQGSILAGGAYLGGEGLMGLGGAGDAADPFSVASGNELTSLFGGGSAGGGGSGLMSELGLPDISGSGVLSDATSFINALRGGAGGSSGNALLDAASSNPSLAMRVLPGVMALGYAASQPSLDLGQLNNIGGELAGNQNAVIQAATDPIQRNIAAGYGDLLQSQALRGIRGSSFGDTDIANYIGDTSRALGNAGANAAQGSLGLQSDLATNIAQLQNQRQQLKNNLYGTAFDVLGRGLNPQGYAANFGMVNPTGMPSVPNQPNRLQSLLGAGNSLLGDFGTSLGGVASSIGHALGSIF